MTTQSDPYSRQIFARRLTPHRSLTPETFRTLIIVFGVVSFGCSLPFMVLGAWPVVGFFGLDVLGLYLAFIANFRAARISETLDVTPLELVFTKTGVDGKSRQWRFNPSWVRLEEKVHEEFGPQHVSLVSRGERIEIGAFLGPDQKAELARDLAKALATARLGARFS
jgi:uncharacterized membrane protein